ncbi:large subunit ribosomal protein L24e [Candidatus Methanophagaceae archaeon]|jgi:large subunit ribosomal protein L24e|nr:large subunit ribosomal protein L24e [Methanophagales archaeon]KAF5438046.1 large subunit ribosomal protein L24e [Methanophagales archaeon]MEA3488254.1 50S ribosomal protein L24e [Euryarchaeota archaeon]
MEKRCSFCDLPIEPGTGMMFVKRDGTVLYFCSSKCERNMVKLRRKRRKVRWAAKAKVDSPRF